MRLEMPSGSYVVAVSGGVDSMALLDLLRLHPGLKLIVAHYDHGIRDDSAEDRKYVAQLARRYGLPFVYDEGKLGSGTSEAVAREARYDFLRRTQRASGADAVITAHHQNDVMETAIINLLRGTGRKGLTSLTNGEGIIRPLRDVPKSEIIDYAKRHGLVWREDSTNANTDYLRNHVRLNVLPRWHEQARAQLIDIIERTRVINDEIDGILQKDITEQLDREWFTLLPHKVAREYVAAWLRHHGIHDFDTRGLERLTVAAKIAKPGKVFDIVKGHKMRVGKDFLALEHIER